jgi:hypothetical protein
VGNAGSRGDRISLLKERGCGIELSGEYEQACVVGEPNWKGSESAGVPSGPDAETGELMAGLVVPQLGRDTQAKRTSRPTRP